MSLFEKSPCWEFVASYVDWECPSSYDRDDGSLYEEACPEICSVNLDDEGFTYMKVHHEDNMRRVHYEKLIFASEREETCVFKMSVKKIEWDCNIGLDLKYNPALWEEYYGMVVDDRSFILEECLLKTPLYFFSYGNYWLESPRD